MTPPEEGGAPPPDTTTATTTATTTQQAPPGTPAAEPWHQKAFNADGTFAPKWQTHLPADYEDLRGIAAQHGDLKGILGALRDNMTAARAKPHGLTVPAEDAPQEVKDAYNSELKKLWGVPAAPEDYKLAAPAQVPEGLEFNPEMAAQFSSFAHELGLTKAQADKLLEYDMGRLSGAQQLQKQQQEELATAERAEMQKRWGDRVDETLLTAKRVAHTLPEADKLFDPKSPMFVGVELTDFMAKLAPVLGEDRIGSVASVANMDPGTMATDIMTNPNNPEYTAYRNAEHPNSAAVRAKVDELLKRAGPAR